MDEITITVENCLHCPHYKWNCGDMCTHADRPDCTTRLASQERVPDFCPLRGKRKVFVYPPTSGEAEE